MLVVWKASLEKVPFVRFYARYWESRGNKNRSCLLGFQRRHAKEMCSMLPVVCLWGKACTHSWHTLQQLALGIGILPWES